jgi:hypothetical protein
VHGCIVASDGDGFERRNCLAGAALHGQGATQHVKGARVMRITRQHLGRDRLGVLRPSLIQGKHGPRQRVVACRRHFECPAKTRRLTNEVL